MALTLLGLPMAWARIYLGVHFPFDMAGAAAVGACSAWLAVRAEPVYVELCYRFASHVHRRLFGRLIAAGWLRG
jgi:undecaprenyl-diphosphatase